MEEIKTASAGAYQYLVDKDPCTWSRAYFKKGMDCDAVENGFSESFNSRIKIARRKPIIRMLEEIRSYVMTRNYTLRKECEDWKSEIFPNIRKVLELHKKIQRKWSLSLSGWHQFEVRQGNGLEALCVDLEKRECSCRQWQLTSVPFPHSITSMYFINTNPDDYVSDLFKPLSLSFDFIFNSEIFKSFPCLSLSSLPSCNLILYWNEAATMSFEGRFNLEEPPMIGFPALSVRSSNAHALDSLYLLVLFTEMSQSRQHVDTSMIHVESRKSPIVERFDVDSRRISIRHCEYLRVSL
ncbi:hypothetical protein Tco_0821025 [Tanacetum coccineum]|uniref:Uncharacterized protein n=1 Tax=Tanacetum coccineum TaxID=301880 RepID=A0ABQ5AB34_9ASTR